MTDAPFPARYDGDGQFSAPSPHWARECDKQFVVGMIYRMTEHHERSTATHNHYFASIVNAWQTLPDELLAEYPSAEHLRKKLLVKAGFADERSIVCASKAEAQRVAAFVKPMDEYAVVLVREAVVRVYTAQSQSYRAMGKRTFQESKEAVLRAIDELLGVSEPEPQERAA